MSTVFDVTSDNLVFDASGEHFIQGVTNFTAENLGRALEMSDNMDQFNFLGVHTAVYNRIRRNNLIDFGCVPGTDACVPFFQGLQIVFNDRFPREGNVYTSYIFKISPYSYPARAISLITREA